MKVIISEYLRIDLDTESWECRRCRHVLGSARRNYKELTRVYARDPREIHKPLLDPEKYEYTYSPDPAWCVILEFYCPNCGAMIETEYTVPGHPPIHDLELDIDKLKIQWADREELSEPAADGAPPSLPGSCHDH